MAFDPQTVADRIGMTGKIDEASLRWLENAFRASFQIDGTIRAERLIQCLRLPAGQRAAIARRNQWLRIAAEELPPHRRAAALHRAIVAFMAHQWPAWCQANEPPAAASALQRALFAAADAGAPMELVRRQVGNILNGK